MLQTAVAPALAGLQSPNWYWITMQLIVRADGVAASMALLATHRGYLREHRRHRCHSDVGLAMIFREYVEIDRAVKACFDTGELLCFVEPSAFARFAIYASIGLAEKILLFTISLAVEPRISNRDSTPESRR